MRFAFSVLALLVTFAAAPHLARAAEGDAVVDAHPCKKLREACEAAGFKKGDHKDKKGLFKDCMQPLLKGQTVAGVTPPAGDVDACKAKEGAKHK